jgi:superfamily II DNA/RNA helicase
VQVALFSATLSAEARHVIGKSFPNMELCFTPCAHRAPPTLKHRLLHVDGDRMELLIKQARALGPCAPALVFCRGIDSARAVQMSLAEAGLSVAGCHGGIPDEARAEVLAAFAAGQHNILVATDLAARGLHLPHVGTVINFDFPASSALYLHRAGRTAR